jgi:hypothetical protein
MSAGRNNISINKDYNTPPKYIELINLFFNNSIDLDPCSNNYSLIKSLVSFKLPQNGLEEVWNYRNIYINPPYGINKDKSNLYNWVYKSYITNKNFNSEILMLIPVATNTKHFKNLIFKYAKGICFLEDTRLKFWYKGEEIKKGAPMACCIVYFGNNFEKFNNIFNNVGKCFKI